MEIPQELIDELILTLHQSQNPATLLGCSSGLSTRNLSLQSSKIRHRHQQQAVAQTIHSMLEFASPHLQSRLGSTYRRIIPEI